MYRRAFSFLGFVLWLSSAVAVEPDLYPAPSPNSADEPLAKALSLEKAGTFLDRAVFAWTREQNCGSCHTSYPYLMARPAIGDAKAPALLEMRSFIGVAPNARRLTAEAERSRSTRRSILSS